MDHIENSYLQTEDPMLFELHEIRHTIADTAGFSPESVNKKGHEIMHEFNFDIEKVQPRDVRIS